MVHTYQVQFYTRFTLRFRNCNVKLKFETRLQIYDTVATPAQQRSHVISMSEHPRARSPGCTFFLKKVDFFLVVALKTQRPPTPLRLFHIKRSAVRYSNTIFIFCSHYYRNKAIDRAKPGRWII